MNRVALLKRPTELGLEFEFVVYPTGLDADLLALNRYRGINVTTERDGRLVLTLGVKGAGQDELVRRLLARMGIDRVEIAEAPSVCALCRAPKPVADTEFGAACEACFETLRWKGESASAVDLEVA